ncbi:MAG TPA: s-methyl-5-thioribose-1-phosphate isomerase [Candidatus Limnocylindrales bacterium]
MDRPVTSPAASASGPAAPPDSPAAAPAPPDPAEPPSPASDSPTSAPAPASDEAIPTFLLRNVARYEEGVVSILDRRRYPFEVAWVACPTHEDVARAIEAMVTQSLGPGLCAGYAMVQAAREARDRGAGFRPALDAAAARLVATRPTNADIRLTVAAMLAAVEDVADPADGERILLGAIERRWADAHEHYRTVGRFGAALLHDGDTVLTHCWGESGLVYTLHAAVQAGKRLAVVCTETRPYLQGARLTADAVADLGLPVTVVTDGMPASLMDAGRIQVFISGADRVTMDGHVVNKVGTLPLAIAAARFGVPYYPLCEGPDPAARGRADVVIEERDPAEVLHCLGVRTATEKAQGYYPAFDVTPPDLVAGVVTDRGVFAADRLADYFGG